MKVTTTIEEARQAAEAAVQRMEAQSKLIAELPDDSTDEERSVQSKLYGTLGEEAERLQSVVQRHIDIQQARERLPDLSELEAQETEGRTRVSVEKEPLIYERGNGHSFFHDVIRGTLDNAPDANERLARHATQMKVEKRDVSTSTTGAGSFIPPIYLGEQYIDKAIEGRPFADAVAKMPYSPAGKTMTIPRVATMVTTAVQAAEADPPSETDFDGEDYTVTKAMIAGMSDVSIQAFDWTDPGYEEVVMRDLVRSYNQTLDTQLISGTGANGQHDGLRNIDNINTVAFASGNGAAFLGTVYAAQSEITTDAPGYMGTAILIHPRRAAWMASHRDENNNLLQQGGITWGAAGTQDMGFTENIAGLRIIRDGNIATNLGTNTRDDEVYVLDPSELFLAEGPLTVRALREVLSGTLQVRLQIYGYSAFFGGRRPATIARVTGAGLTTPTFPST